MNSSGLDIYYDGECPFCSNYVSRLQLKKTVGKLSLVNVREDRDSLKELERLGFELDEGMVVKYKGKYYTGAEAMNILALLGSPSNIFNYINNIIFSVKWLAVIFYPVLRAGRNAALFVMGKGRINNKSDKKTLDQYHIFAFLFGIFSVYHFIVYATSYRAHLYPASWANLVLGILLICNPGSKRLFVASVIALLFDGWLHAPTASNHTIMLDFLVVGIAFAGLWNWLVKAGNFEDFFKGFAPVGRCLLIMMYFFGVFHKINEGFLNPATSCATMLMHKMPVLSYFADNVFMQYSGIYGTFVIEGFVIVCLLVRRWHYYGVVVGILFHMMLATSVFNSYLAFSSFSVMLHTLFLPKDTLGNFRKSKFYKWVINPASRNKQYHILSGIFFLQLLMNILSVNDVMKMASALPWLMVFIPFVCFVIAYAKPEKKDMERGFFISPMLIVNIVTVLFFVNCISPYLGLKTKQSINMFANLQLEGGKSNHLIFTKPPSVFNYLDDLVSIKKISKRSQLHLFANNGYKVVYYELLNVLERERDTKVTFERDGKLYEKQSYETLKQDADRTLHNRWVRKWLYFNSVSTSDPKACSNYN